MGKNDSPYDDSGMPLGTTTADYDNADEIRKNQVRSTYVEPLPLNDPEYQPKQFTKKETGQDKNKGLPFGVKGFNNSLESTPESAEEKDLSVTRAENDFFVELVRHDEDPKEEAPKDDK
jgi:hypothetical protein